MTHYITISGGKDSTAAWLYVERELGIPCVPLFCDTGHEAQQTYDYVRYLEQEMGQEIHWLQGNLKQIGGPDEPMTMASLAKHKKRFPSSTARFCTTELKLRPLRRYLAKVIRSSPCPTCSATPGTPCVVRGDGILTADESPEARRTTCVSKYGLCE